MEFVVFVAIAYGMYYLWNKIEREQSGGNLGADYQDKEWTEADERKFKEAEAKKRITSPHDLAICYGYILDLLNESYRTKPDARWRVVKSSPEEGRIVAQIEWKEFFGEKLGEKLRRIILSIDLEPDDDETDIYLQWDVESPINKSQVNEVMETMKSAIKTNLGAK